MFDRPGISIDDLPWIHRDQFVHYVQLAHALSDAHDWPRLRDDLLGALTAAFALDVAAVDRDRLTTPQRRALDVLDDIRSHHDPATDWSAFFDMLWTRRHAIRLDLA